MIAFLARFKAWRHTRQWHTNHHSSRLRRRTPAGVVLHLRGRVNRVSAIPTPEVLEAIKAAFAAPCDMRSGEPYDFAWCETHDSTFPLGDTCPYDREPR